MIAKKFRLERYLVQKILKKGQSKKLGLFTLRYAPNKTSRYRWAIVLSTKFEKSAVIRNYKKRQIYEAIRLLLDTAGNMEPVKKDKTFYDIVMIPHKQILSCKYDKIDQNVHDIFKFINSLNTI